MNVLFLLDNINYNTNLLKLSFDPKLPINYSTDNVYLFYICADYIIYIVANFYYAEYIKNLIGSIGRLNHNISKLIILLVLS